MWYFKHTAIESREVRQSVRSTVFRSNAAGFSSKPKSYWQWCIAFCSWFIHLFLLFWFEQSSTSCLHHALNFLGGKTYWKTFLICINLGKYYCGNVDTYKVYTISTFINYSNDSNEKHFNMQPLALLHFLQWQYFLHAFFFCFVFQVNFTLFIQMSL